MRRVNRIVIKGRPTSFLNLVFFVLILLIPSLSCKNNKKYSSDCIKQTITKDIPEVRKDSLHIKIKRKIEYLAGLKDLEKGFNQIQIRMWLPYKPDQEQLLILQKSHNRWSGSLNVLEFVYDEKNTFELRSINRKSKEVSPKSGWQLFTDSLFKLGILTLPNMVRPWQGEMGTSLSFTVEYADCNRYRIYTCQNPFELKDEYWQAKNVTQICGLLERELQFETKLLHKKAQLMYKE